jgi:hypothetical protein
LNRNTLFWLGYLHLHWNPPICLSPIYYNCKLPRLMHLLGRDTFRTYSMLPATIRHPQTVPSRQ